MLDLANSHRSIRSFTDQKIEESLLNDILHTGLRSSSSGNLQTWAVIVTQDPENKQKLFKAHYEQPMVNEAPAVLTFCADLFRTREWIRVNNSKQSFDNILAFLVGAFDAMIAAQTICLAAESKGLGICYMGTTLMSADKIIDILDLPQYVFPATSIVIGYPAESPPLRDRLPLDLVVHHEKYQRLTDSELIDKHAEREKNAWERYNAMESIRVKLAEAGITKVTDFYTSEFKYSQKMHTEVSKMIVETLQKQGLLLL